MNRLAERYRVVGFDLKGPVVEENREMDWNTVLLIALVVVMLLCCGGMMRMGTGKRRDDEEDKQ